MWMTQRNNHRLSSSNSTRISDRNNNNSSSSSSSNKNTSNSSSRMPISSCPPSDRRRRRPRREGGSHCDLVDHVPCPCRAAEAGEAAVRARARARSATAVAAAAAAAISFCTLYAHLIIQLCNGGTEAGGFTVQALSLQPLSKRRCRLGPSSFSSPIPIVSQSSSLLLLPTTSRSSSSYFSSTLFASASFSSRDSGSSNTNKENGDNNGRTNNSTDFVATAAEMTTDLQSTASATATTPPSTKLLAAADGLSRLHQSIVSRTISQRQRFVTGRYPVTVTVTENPTRQWLARAKGQAATCEILVNGTTPHRSLASMHGRRQWLIEEEEEWTMVVPNQEDHHHMLSLELIAEVHMERPGYLHILPSDAAGANAAIWRQQQKQKRQRQQLLDIDITNQLQHSWNDLRVLASNNKNGNQANGYRKDPASSFLFGHRLSQHTHQQHGFQEKQQNDHEHRQQQQQQQKLSSSERLWVTGFSLLARRNSRGGMLRSLECKCGTMQSVNERTMALALLWPNEVVPVPKHLVDHRHVAALVNGNDDYQHGLIESTTRPQPSQAIIQQMYDDSPFASDVNLFTISRDQPMGGRRTSSKLPASTAALATKPAPARHIVSSYTFDKSTKTDEQHQPQQPSPYKITAFQDALLICDGFLVPGRDRGGIHVVQYPGHPQAECTVSLTDMSGDSNNRWFYHKANWIDLTKDGRLSILTARSRVSAQGLLRTNKSKKDTTYAKFVTSGLVTEGELVWLECPEPASVDPNSGDLLEADGTAFNPFASHHLPWKEHVLTKGPDVMFCLADLDTTDDTIEVISSQFFRKRVVLHSIQLGERPKVTMERVLDSRCGSAFGVILAQLDESGMDSNMHANKVIASGSTVATMEPWDSFSHLLVTSHECSYAEKEISQHLGNAKADIDTTAFTSLSNEGGSLYAYRVPKNWKTDPWTRTTVAAGFKVDGQIKNMINPGAPGFVYTFYANRSEHTERGRRPRPLIAVAGDCAESAYIFRPEQPGNYEGDGDANDIFDPSTNYKLMVEIQCGATVGSIGVGYDKFVEGVEQDEGYAKLYIPCYEKDKVLVFAFGSGQDQQLHENNDDGAW